MTHHLFSDLATKACSECGEIQPAEPGDSCSDCGGALRRLTRDEQAQIDREDAKDPK